jgi:hypothetical protein
MTKMTETARRRDQIAGLRARALECRREAFGILEGQYDPDPTGTKPDRPHDPNVDRLELEATRCHRTADAMILRDERRAAKS